LNPNGVSAAASTSDRSDHCLDEKKVDRTHTQTTTTTPRDERFVLNACLVIACLRLLKV